jgi:hypothetical protein
MRSTIAADQRFCYVLMIVNAMRARYPADYPDRSTALGATLLV